MTDRFIIPAFLIQVRRDGLILRPGIGLPWEKSIVKTDLLFPRNYLQSFDAAYLRNIIFRNRIELMKQL